MICASDIRHMIASLEDATEEPHHHLTSFRINGKIFATMPADASFLNIFVNEQEREAMLGMHPNAYEKVWWGKKVIGIRALPEKAQKEDVARLLKIACQDKS